MTQDSGRYNIFSNSKLAVWRWPLIGSMAVLAVAVVVMFVVQGVGKTARQTVIEVTDKGFVPATITVKPGSTVVWRNADTAPHAVASNPYPADSSVGGLHSRIIPPNGSYTYVADTNGTIGYHDETQPTSNGTLVVGR